MTEAEATAAAKVALRSLIEETASMAAANSMTLDALRGCAYCDMSRDAPILALGSFDKATLAVSSLPDFVVRFGTQDIARILLQFVYGYYARSSSILYEDVVFEAVWSDLTAEIQEPLWVTRGVANVRNFTSDSHPLALGDGVAIRERNNDELTSLGFSRAVLDRLLEDWSGFGASSFVMVVEHSVPKQPGNIITIDSGTVWTKAMRTVGALRLADAGAFSNGPMWVIRAAQFNAGLGGLQRVGVSIPAIGSPYAWTESTAKLVPDIYGALAKLERDGYGRSPGNLAVSLRSFMATYDRWPSWPDSQLLDSVTALEALLGTETEISFKLAFRVSALLAENDGRRAEVLKLIKEFYDTRSTIVHGGHLKEKHQQRLAKVDDLRALVRRLLRSFVTFAAGPPGQYHGRFFTEQLDQALVDATEREKLRTALGLSS